MKRSVLTIFLLFAAIPLLAGWGLGERAGIPAVCETAEPVEVCFNTPDYISNYTDLETSFPVLPIQIQAVRKLYERMQRINASASNISGNQYFSIGRNCSDESVNLSSILSGRLAQPSHSADYITFGTLLI